VTARKDVEARDRDGRTGLINAAYSGDPALVKSWLAEGADVNGADRGGWTALHAAVYYWHLATVEALLDAGANIEAEDVHGKAPLSELRRRAVFLELAGC
jgi:ankyrin repeat protein